MLVPWLLNSLTFPNPEPCGMEEYPASFPWEVLRLQRVEVLT